MSRTQLVEPEVQIILLFNGLSEEGKRIVAGFIRSQVQPEPQKRAKRGSKKKTPGLPKTNGQDNTQNAADLNS